MSSSLFTVPELLAAVARKRGLELTAHENLNGAWMLCDPKTGQKTPLVVTQLELIRNGDDPNAAMDLVEAKFKLAERTLENLEDLRRNQLYEVMLVGRGWVPPAGWKHPFKDPPEAKP